MFVIQLFAGAVFTPAAGGSTTSTPLEKTK
jgi:hypothetical protein